MFPVIYKVCAFGLLTALRIYHHRVWLRDLVRNRRVKDKEFAIRLNNTIWLTRVPGRKISNYRENLLALEYEGYWCQFDDRTEALRVVTADEQVDLFATITNDDETDKTCRVIYVGTHSEISRALESRSFKVSATLFMIMAFVFSLF